MPQKSKKQTLPHQHSYYRETVDIASNENTGREQLYAVEIDFKFEIRP